MGVRRRRQHLGRIHDLVKGGSEKRLSTLTNCCYLTSLFFRKKKYGQNISICFTLGGSTEPPEPTRDQPQNIVVVPFKRAQQYCATLRQS